MKKQIALALLFAILAQLTACGGGSGDNETTPSDASDTTPMEETTSLFKADLPEKNYGGYEFRMLSTEETGLRRSRELFAETETGETLNDAVFKRNRAVEDEFNVKLVNIEGATADLPSLFGGSIMAGDDDYDLLVIDQQNMLTLASQYGLSVEDMPYINIEDSWWDADVIKAAAIGGKAYALSGDINIVDNNATYCMLFNKQIAKENKIEDLYSLVREGKWTMDAMETVCKNIRIDLTGEGTYDFNDQWPLVGSGNTGFGMMWSCGGGLSRMNDNGELEFIIDSEKTIMALTRIFELYQNKDIFYDVANINPPEGETTFSASRIMFREGRILFLSGMVNYAEQFRDMEDEFGMLPNPKYDENQDKYYAITQTWTASMILAPNNAKDPERTSIILDAMASAAQQTILPAYYDEVLARKVARDDDSAEMLDFIFDGMVLDVAYAFDFGGVSSLAGCITARSNIVSSQTELYSRTAKNAYDRKIADILGQE